MNRQAEGRRARRRPSTSILAVTSSADLDAAAARIVCLVESDDAGDGDIDAEEEDRFLRELHDTSTPEAARWSLALARVMCAGEVASPGIVRRCRSHRKTRLLKKVLTAGMPASMVTLVRNVHGIEERNPLVRRLVWAHLLCLPVMDHPAKEFLPGPGYFPQALASASSASDSGGHDNLGMGWRADALELLRAFVSPVTETSAPLMRLWARMVEPLMRPVRGFADAGVDVWAAEGEAVRVAGGPFDVMDDHPSGQTWMSYARPAGAGAALLYGCLFDETGNGLNPLLMLKDTAAEQLLLDSPTLPPTQTRAQYAGYVREVVADALALGMVPRFLHSEEGVAGAAGDVSLFLAAHRETQAGWEAEVRPVLEMCLAHGAVDLNLPLSQYLTLASSGRFTGLSGRVCRGLSGVHPLFAAIQMDNPPAAAALIELGCRTDPEVVFHVSEYCHDNDIPDLPPRADGTPRQAMVKSDCAGLELAEVAMFQGRPRVAAAIAATLMTMAMKSAEADKTPQAAREAAAPSATARRRRGMQL